MSAARRPGPGSAGEEREPVVEVSTGHSFLESPRWHDGELWASDFFTGRVLRFSSADVRTMLTLEDGQPSGIAWDSAGRLIVASMLDRRLLRSSIDGVEVLADLTSQAPWHINDLTVDESDAVYVGNFGWDDAASEVIQATELLRVDPAGGVTIAARDLVFPNGITITPDGGTLLVAETFAGRITAFTRRADGSLVERRPWADLAEGLAFTTTGEALQSGVPLPDGIALDAEGALWVGDAGGRGALRVREGGEVCERVDVGDDQTAFATALGGPDGRTLFLCAGAPYGVGDPRTSRTGRMLSTRVRVPAAGR